MPPLLAYLESVTAMSCLSASRLVQVLLVGEESTHILVNGVPGEFILMVPGEEAKTLTANGAESEIYSFLLAGGKVLY